MKDDLIPMDEMEQTAAARENAAAAEFVSYRESLGGDSSFSELLAELFRDFGGAKLTMPVLEELVDTLKASGEMAGHRQRSAVKLPRWMGKFLKILRYVKEHPNSTAIYAVLHIWDEPLLDAINRHQNQVEFADCIGLDKAAVNNAVMDAQRFFKTRPRRDQRKTDAKNKMSAVLIHRIEGRTARATPNDQAH